MKYKIIIILSILVSGCIGNDKPKDFDIRVFEAENCAYQIYYNNVWYNSAEKLVPPETWIKIHIHRKDGYVFVVFENDTCKVINKKEFAKRIVEIYNRQDERLTSLFNKKDILQKEKDRLQKEISQIDIEIDAAGK